MRLQVKPTLGIRTKEHGQTQCSINGNAAQPVHNFIDAPWGNINRFGEGVLADTHRLEPVFKQDFAGVNQGDFAGPEILLQ